ncbi:bifunctional UDP-sugar hydrolase/5'-nucleotidase [Halobaculum sp. MBLA0147]|uniref:bifunctional metallophosphatase/5'-nucleotidase n=1 Tax=Halobaculum sp. MBLA0147 TaxID=3079934 RepID=UPI003524142D
MPPLPTTNRRAQACPHEGGDTHHMVTLLHHSDVENVYDDHDRAARLAGLLAARAGDDALVVGTGDDTAPGVLPLVTGGRQAIPFFEAAGTALETFGNHDFDFGVEATRELVADAPPTWVTVNVRDERGEPFAVHDGVEPWVVRTVGDERVGFFGVTDPATDSLNPEAAELSFDDPLPAAREAVADLRAAGVDHVVALSHLGQGDDDLARLDGVDAVLGGHVHSRRVDHVDGTLVTRPGVNGTCVVAVELTADGATGDLLHVDEVVAAESVEPAASVATALADRVSEAGLDRTVAHVDDRIERTETTAHGGESRIGNLVADAYRAAADVDVGLQNAGGLRLGEPLTGDVTLADCIGVLPFEEPVVVCELTGAELRDVARQMSASVVDFGDPEWWHGHVSGLELLFDRETETVRELRVGGEPVVDDRLYTVATPEYVLHSDHEFPAIGERHRAGEHGVQHEVLADYLRDNPVPPVEGRVRFVGEE